MSGACGGSAKRSLPHDSLVGAAAKSSQMTPFVREWGDASSMAHRQLWAAGSGMDIPSADRLADYQQDRHVRPHRYHSPVTDADSAPGSFVAASEAAVASVPWPAGGSNIWFSQLQPPELQRRQWTEGQQRSEPLWQLPAAANESVRDGSNPGPFTGLNVAERVTAATGGQRKRQLDHQQGQHPGGVDWTSLDPWSSSVDEHQHRPSQIGRVSLLPPMSQLGATAPPSHLVGQLETLLAEQSIDSQRAAHPQAPPQLQLSGLWQQQQQGEAGAWSLERISSLLAGLDAQQAASRNFELGGVDNRLHSDDQPLATQLQHQQDLQDWHHQLSTASQHLGDIPPPSSLLPSLEALTSRPPPPGSEQQQNRQQQAAISVQEVLADVQKLLQGAGIHQGIRRLAADQRPGGSGEASAGSFS